MSSRLRIALAGLILSCGAPLTPAEELCLSSSTEALSRICQGKNVVSGPDVSYYQGTVKWAQVKNAGQVFAIARVSDGAGTVDSQFNANWKGMRSAGLVRGVYQFFRPAQDPVAQANLLLNKVALAGGFVASDLPPVVDVEVVDGQSTATIRAKLKQWLEVIEKATNKKPIIYTAAFMNSVVGTGFSAYPLWVANYGASCPSVPDGWNQWKFWQYTSTGSISGISGSVDTNRFNGTFTQLQTFASTVVDAGHAVDAGTKSDAGTKFDAGTPVDAGQLHDAGTSTRLDAGLGLGGDAGFFDAGVDAGSSADDDDSDAGASEPDGGEGSVIGSGALLYLDTCRALTP